MGFARSSARPPARNRSWPIALTALVALLPVAFNR
jgi:hypothetical protein